MVFFEENKEIINTGVLTLSSILVSLGIHFNSKESTEKRKTEAILKWETKDENTRYKILQEDLFKYGKELKIIEDELNSLAKPI